MAPKQRRPQEQPPAGPSAELTPDKLRIDDSVPQSTLRIDTGSEGYGGVFDVDISELVKNNTASMQNINDRVAADTIQRIEGYTARTEAANTEALKQLCTEQATAWFATMAFLDPEYSKGILTRAMSTTLSTYTDKRNAYEMMAQNAQVIINPLIGNAQKFDVEPSHTDTPSLDAIRIAIELHSLATQLMKDGTFPAGFEDGKQPFFPNIPARTIGKFKKQSLSPKVFLDELAAAGGTLESLRQSALKLYDCVEGDLFTTLALAGSLVTDNPTYFKKPSDYKRHRQYLKEVVGKFEQLLLEGLVPAGYGTDQCDAIQVITETKIEQMLRKLPNGVDPSLLETGVSLYQNMLDQRAKNRKQLTDNEARWPSQPSPVNLAEAVSAEPETLPEAPAAVEPSETSAETKTNTERETLVFTHDRLMVKYVAVLAPFRVSSRSLRKDGLHNLVRDLTFGFTDLESGNKILELPDHQAKRILETLCGLRNLEPKPGSQLKSILEATLDQEVQIIDSIKAIRPRLKALGINGFPGAQQELLTDLFWLQQNQQVLRLLINKHLTADVAASYHNLLDQLYAVGKPAPSLLNLMDVTLEPITAPVETHIPVENHEPAINIPLQETNEAMQLDWEIFPADMALETIIFKTKQSFGEKISEQIDWRRIHDLIRLKNATSGVMYRSKPQALGSEIPYFVVVSNFNGNEFAIAENPKYGNATYVLRTQLADYGASWQQVFEQSRAFARLLGAERVVHRDSNNHLMRIIDKVQEQLLVIPKASV